MTKKPTPVRLMSLTADSRSSDGGPFVMRIIMFLAYFLVWFVRRAVLRIVDTAEPVFLLPPIFLMDSIASHVSDFDDSPNGSTVSVLSPNWTKLNRVLGLEMMPAPSSPILDISERLMDPTRFFSHDCNTRTS